MCGIRLTQTVIAQWSKAQVSHLMVVRSSLLRSRFLTYSFKHCKHVYYLFDILVNFKFQVFSVFLFRITKQIPRSVKTIPHVIKQNEIVWRQCFYQTTFYHKSREFQFTSMFAR